MAQWRKWTSPAILASDGITCTFGTPALKGRIGDGRFIGLNQVTDTRTGAKISGDGTVNRHGLLTLYRVFTRNHLYGESAYDWNEREMNGMGWSSILFMKFRLMRRWAWRSPYVSETPLIPPTPSSP